MLWNGIFLLIFGLLVGIEFAYRDPLFDLNNQIVPKMQEKDSFMHHLMEAIAYLGESPGVICTACIAVSVLPYSKGIFYLLVLSLMSFLNAFMKILYHDPRPFYVDEDVQALHCSKSYGNPSGHTMYFTCVFPMLFYLIFHSKVKGYYSLSLNNYKHKLIYKIIYVFTLAFFIFICVGGVFGRIYLGVHSLNQVLHGGLLGLTLFFYLFFIAYLPLQNTIYRYTERNCTKGEFIVGLLTSISIIVGMLGLALIGYGINIGTFEDKQEWIEAISRQCDIPERDLEDNDMFVRASLKSMFSPAGIYGCLVGMVIYGYFGQVPVNKYKLLPVWKSALRVLTNLILTSPFIALNFIPDDAPYSVILIFGEFLMAFGFSS